MIEKLDKLYERQTKIMDAIVLLKNHVDERFGALPLQEQLFEISMVTTQEEMVDLEQNLADQEYLDKFKSRISRIGGEDFGSAIIEIMDRYFSKSFLSLCNMEGANGKFAFKNSLAYKAISDVITTRYSSTTDHDVAKKVQNKLRNAPAQKGGLGRKKKN